MSSGVVDFRKAISGSHSGGTWEFEHKKYDFDISELPPYDVTWVKSYPPFSKEVENRISMLAEHFFSEEGCTVDKNKT